MAVRDIQGRPILLTVFDWAFGAILIAAGSWDFCRFIIAGLPLAGIALLCVSTALSCALGVAVLRGNRLAYFVLTVIFATTLITGLAYRYMIPGGEVHWKGILMSCTFLVGAPLRLMLFKERLKTTAG